MSILRRVLLLLSVAVLLREGSSSSPLDFLRDLKNRIFVSGDTTESTEETSVQCSGLDQDGVCVLPQKTYNKTLEESNILQGTQTFDSSDLVNSTQGSDTNTEETSDQFEGNGTAMEYIYNTNNTQYYDEQEWNNTVSNNTENYGNDFEYPENEQNGTDLNREASTSNGDETNVQTARTRSKRQIEINITLKKQGVSTYKPFTLSATVLATSQPENLNNSWTDKFSNITGGQRVFPNTSENHTGGLQNESIAADFDQATDEYKSVVINKVTSNETKEVILDNKQKTNESTNITLESLEYPGMVSTNGTEGEFLQLQNGTEEINKSYSSSVNCTNCTALKEGSTDFQNISLSLDKDLNDLVEILKQLKNGKEPTESEHGKNNVNSTQLDNNSITSLTNITKLKDIIENSTQVIENITKLKYIMENSSWLLNKIVQNIAPVISITKDETELNETNDNTVERVQNMKLKEEQNHSSETVNSKNTETESRDRIIYDGKLKSIISPIIITSEENVNTTIDTSNETFILNLSGSQPLVMNLNYSMVYENNITNYVGVNATSNVSNSNTDMKREKRSINFTILTEDDEEEPDLSISSSSGATESPTTEMSFSTVLNSTESSLTNDTQAIEVVGPVCFKRYEQCTNSTDCCENYECIEAEENNSTSFCDLRPISPSLPIKSTAD